MRLNDIHNSNGDTMHIASGEWNRFRVCAFNVGNFCRGISGTAQGDNEMYNQFIELFRKSNADIYMFSEWDLYWNQSEGKLSDNVLGRLRPYHTQNGIYVGYVGQMVYSSFPLKSENVVSFNTSSDNRYFVDHTVQINGIDVHVICTHLPWETEALRAQDITILLNYIANNDINHYVIGGDFNLGLDTNASGITTQQHMLDIARRDVSLLESRSAVSIQGGYWGDPDVDHFIDTVTRGHRGSFDGFTCMPFDNVVLSPNLTILSTEVIVAPASDHDAICVDIEVSQSE